MKKFKLSFALIFFSPVFAQVTTSEELVKIHSLTSSDFNNLNTPVEGQLAFNTETQKLLVYADNEWKVLLLKPKVSEKTSDYTLTINDNCNVVLFNSSTDITLTVPSGSPVGYNVSIYQTGEGKIHFVGSGGSVLLNRLTRFTSAGKNAGIGVLCTSENTYHLTGDLKKN